jgi:GT2 family glycosyltransferase
MVRGGCDVRKATLIVLVWNKWELTRRCLETLSRTHLPDTEVIVVDNGSTDETSRELARMRWVRVVRLSENTGYVRGNNVGIEAADPDSDIVLLNNDVEFHQRDWLERLRSCAYASDDIGIVGCRLILPDGRLLHAGTYILSDTLWGQQIGALEKDFGQYRCDRDVQGVVFAVAYLRRDVLNAMGGLCTDFHSYFEDTDYCLRAAEIGFRTLVCGEVTLVHAQHGSSGSEAATLRLFRSSQSMFRRKWETRLREREKPEFLWQSVMSLPGGYAESCKALVRAFVRQGARPLYRYAYGLGTAFPFAEPAATHEYLLDVVRQRPVPRKPRVGVVYAQGDVFARNPASCRVGYTMLEVDGFPAEWVRQAQGMEEVWTPTEFNRQGLLTSGLRRPVHVMPLGVDTNYFHPGIRGLRNPHGEFVFLTSLEWGERKAPELLLRAFSETFHAREPVRLVAKISNTDPSVSLKAQVSRLGLRAQGGRISYLLNRALPYHELGALYGSADCFVSTSRGEGWGMPVLEAMACGLPVIATDWGGHTAYLHEGIAYPLRVRATEPARAKCPYYAGQRWADPDEEHLRYLLRHVFEQREEARSRGLAAAQEVAARWTWDHAAARILTRIEALGGR